MAFNKEEAQKIARDCLDELYRQYAMPNADVSVIMEDKTVEKPYAWIFFYQSKKYLETGNILYAFGGNAPIIVMKDTGEIVTFATAYSFEEELRKFEKERGLG